MGQVSKKLGLNLDTCVQNYTCLWWCHNSYIQSCCCLSSPQGTVLVLLEIFVRNFVRNFSEFSCQLKSSYELHFPES